MPVKEPKAGKPTYAVGDRVDKFCAKCQEERGHIVATITKRGQISRVSCPKHLWGRRRFETKDNSRNSWWVALLTSGEGWHNNHHAYPTSARHGLAWYEVDFNWWGIRVLQLLRLAKGIKLVRLKALPASTDS